MTEPTTSETSSFPETHSPENDYSIAYNKLLDYLTQVLDNTEYDVALQLVHTSFRYHAVAVRGHEVMENKKDETARELRQRSKFDYWQNEALAKISKLDTLIERLRALNDMEAEYCNTHSQRNHVMSVRRTLLEELERQAMSVRFEFAHPQADDIPF